MSQNLHSIQPQPRATVPAVTEAAPIYYGILTDQGQALLAAAIASGTPLPLTAMAAGDGGGQPVTPLAEMTELVNEVHRAPLNQLFVDPTAPNQIVAEMVMAETVGGFWIRELGLFAESGELFAVCNTPDSYKPVLAEGAGRSLLTRMILIVSDTAAVELIINPDTVMASRAYVDAKLAEHAASRDHPAAIEGAQGMIPLATQAMVDEGIDHTSAVTPQTAGITFARLQHEHEIDDVLWLQEALDEKAEVGHTHTPAEAGALPVGSYNPRADAMNNEGGTVTQFIGDLNTLTMGTYVLAKGAGSTNYPDATAGFMYVETRSIYSADALLQVAWPYEADSAVWFRNYSTNSDSWLPWVKIYDTAHKPTAADVGAIPKSGGAFDAGAKVVFSGGLNGPNDVALDMGNQSIGGVHGITFSDSSGDGSEAILWPKTGITGTDPDLADYDSFRVIDGVVYINANKMYHQGFEQPHTIGTPTELGPNVDLHTLTTPGVFSQSHDSDAALALNYPEALAGSLVVYKTANTGVNHEYRIYNSSRVWTCSYFEPEWSEWVLHYNTANKPTAADVEALPLGGGVMTGGIVLDTEIGAHGSTHTGDYFTNIQDWWVPYSNAVSAPITYSLFSPIERNYYLCEDNGGTPAYEGFWARGLLNQYGGAKGATYCIVHTLPNGTEEMVFGFGADGQLNLPRNPTAPGSASTKGYVDEQVASRLPVQTFNHISHPPFRVTYTNTTGLPMMVTCNTTGLGYDTNSLVDMSIELSGGTIPVNLSIKKDSSGEYDDLQKGSGACMVPPGSTFTVHAHDAILGYSTAYAYTAFTTADMRLYVDPTTFGDDGVIRAFASDEERDEWAPECSVEVPVIPDGWSHERHALMDSAWVIRPEWLAMVEVNEVEGRRARMMAKATAQTRHFDMMGDTTQAATWRSYYQQLYALEQAPGWPLVEQWPSAPANT